MDASNRAAWLFGWEIHGFRTMEDLDIASIMKEAGSRWLRPNEIHAILSNHTCFTVNVKPVNLPKSGTIVLFDRKVLRNFRKDGHNWKKKQDGKTVKEAHEHLKVGSDERIHVYYAHGQDDPNFVRRCYWLLDKSLEHIVLVHYRQTQEIQGSPVTPLTSQSASDLSDISASRLLLEETDSGADGAFYVGADGQLEHEDNMNVTNHVMKLHEINTLEWDELLASNEINNSSTHTGDNAKSFGNNTANLQTDGDNFYGSKHTISSLLQSAGSQMDASDINKLSESVMQNSGNVVDNLGQDGLQSQDSFGRWITEIINTDSPGSMEDSISPDPGLVVSPLATNHTPIPQQIFYITEISNSWAFSNEDTKILVIGNFCKEYKNLERSNIFCICGDACVLAEVVQVGVYRCLVSRSTPGLVNLYLSLDGGKPISQVITFEFRAPVTMNKDIAEDKSPWEVFCIQMRLSHLLLSTSKTLEISDVEVSQDAVKEATKFSLKCSNIVNSWSYLTKLIENNQITLSEAKEKLFEVTLKNRLKDWLLERVVLGRKISERDSQGQGAIHLCAMLGYTWAVYPFSLSSLSLDFRDKCGWTALHWAAYYGREKMVGALLSAGAKPNLVTDPTSDSPGGLTAADLAFQNGYDGLAAYLSEKALVQQFKDMKTAGNVSGSLEIANDDSNINGKYESDLNVKSEDDIYLKDTLAAYRTAADAAARIQLAFREHSFNIRTRSIVSSSEMDARSILAAMKIQHAFRNYEVKKQMAAAAHIQYRFRTWKLRRDFINKRRQVIKIQAVFRGYQVRRHYRKILWSVGIVEKAVLRWRLKRKGLRGLQVQSTQPVSELQQDSDSEEDFFRTSRKQAEERVEKAVVRVQAMFRSRKAQQEYRRMKFAYDEAQIDLNESIYSSGYME